MNGSISYAYLIGIGIFAMLFTSTAIQQSYGIATKISRVQLIFPQEKSQQQQNSSGDFVGQELAKFNSQAAAIKSNISSATFTPGNGKVSELIYSVAYLRGEVSTLGAGYSILHSVEDALINKIKQSGPSAFSPSEQARITTWVNDAMANRQTEQQSDFASKVLPGFQR